MLWGRKLLVLFAGLGLLGLFAAPVAAEELYATTTVNVRSGPGTSYGVIGQLRPNEIVTELRCNGARTWCEVRSRVLQGWVSRAYLRPLASGANPGGPVVTPGPQPQPQPSRPGVTPRPGYSLAPSPTVCFYDQPNYQGREMCSGIGDRYPALDPRWERAIRSVRLNGALSVVACTGRNLTGSCATIDWSIPDLGWLADSIMSYRVDARR